MNSDLLDLLQVQARAAVAKGTTTIAPMRSLTDSLGALKSKTELDALSQKLQSFLSAQKKSVHGLCGEAHQTLHANKNSDAAKKEPIPTAVLAVGPAGDKRTAAADGSKASKKAGARKKRKAKGGPSAAPGGTRVAARAHEAAMSVAPEPHAAGPSLTAHLGALGQVATLTLDSAGQTQDLELSTYLETSRELGQFNQTLDHGATLQGMVASGAAELGRGVFDVSELGKITSWFDASSQDQQLMTLLEATDDSMSAVGRSLLVAKKQLGGISKILDVAQQATLILGVATAIFPALGGSISVANRLLKAAHITVELMNVGVEGALTVVTGELFQRAQRANDPQLMGALAKVHVTAAAAAVSAGAKVARRAAASKQGRKLRAAAWKRAIRINKPLVAYGLSAGRDVAEIKRAVNRFNPAHRLDTYVSNKAEARYAKNANKTVRATSDTLAESLGSAATDIVAHGVAAELTADEPTAIATAAIGNDGVCQTPTATAGNHPWTPNLLAKHIQARTAQPQMEATVARYIGYQKGIIAEARSTFASMQHVGAYGRQLDDNALALGARTMAGIAHATAQAAGFGSLTGALDGLISSKGQLQSSPMPDADVPEVAPGNWWQRLIATIQKRLSVVAEATLGRVKEATVSALVGACSGISVEEMRQVAAAASAGNAAALMAGDDATAEQKRIVDRAKEIAGFENETERETAEAIYDAEDAIAEASAYRQTVIASGAALPPSIATGSQYLATLHAYLLEDPAE